MSRFKERYRPVQAHLIAKQIKSTRPDLQHLPAERVIRLYFVEEKELDNQIGESRPISPLYRRVLLYEATQDKAFYFREYMRLLEKSVTMNFEMGDLEVKNVQYQQIARNALTITQGAIDRLDNAGVELTGKVNQN